MKIKKTQLRKFLFLNELHKDFSSNLQQFNNVKTVHTNSLYAAKKFKLYINNPDPILVKDSIAKYYFLAFNGVTYNPSNGVVESLISSGEYQLIKNDTLRNYIISFKDVLEEYTEEEDFSRELWVNKIEPYIIDYGDLSNLASPKNFEIITTTKFKNLTERHILYLNNIVVSINKEPLKYYLKEIVRLSDLK